MSLSGLSRFYFRYYYPTWVISGALVKIRAHFSSRNYLSAAPILNPHAALYMVNSRYYGQYKS